MKKSKRVLLLLVLIFMTGCGSQHEIQEAQEVQETQQVSAEAVESVLYNTINDVTEMVTEEPERNIVSVVAVGDNLYHSTVYKKGYDETGYNFDFVYKNVADLISSYDIAVVNQETPLVTSDYSSYPMFGTPIEAGEALINTGFDVILNATNHSYDKGYNGIESTLNFYAEHPDITYLGIHASEEDYQTVKIIEVNHVKIAMLNYTYGLNGLVVPDDKYYIIDTLYDEEKVKNDLLYAEENADVTIVFPHWGTEYVYEETEYQKYWAELFTEYGADVIIGSHPHVCEPVKYITADNNNTCLCYYSLGNFVSGQDEKPRILGGMASFNIVKENGEVTIEDCEFMPCVTYRTPTDIRVYRLEDYTDEMSAVTNLKATEDYLWKLWYDINKTTEIEYTVGNPVVKKN